MAEADARAAGVVVKMVSPHPNEVDCKRIERTLSQRSRYRYVSPEICPAENGYQIKSPCCSRNVDKTGGVIDIALLEYDQVQQAWRLHRRDHKKRQWLLHGKYRSLTEALQQLNRDPQRIFWP